MDNLNSGGYSFETEKSISGEDDEMAAFEAECAKMLEQEHQRLAEEEKEREIAEAAEAVRAVAMPVLSFESKPTAEPEVTSESEPEAVPESEDVPEVKSLPEPEEEKLPEENTENESESEPESEEKPESQNQVLRDELAAIMKAESEELVLHSAAAETQTQDGETENKSDDADDASDESIPKWLRILFTLLLLLLGGLGVYVMVGMDYGSTVFDPLCFIEIAICTLTAVGINASHIQFRVGKEMIMRLAAYSLFVFYVVYSADCLFLKRLLAYGIDKENIVGYAKTHISLDVVNGLTAMGNSGMCVVCTADCVHAACAFQAVPESDSVSLQHSNYVCCGERCENSNHVRFVRSFAGLHGNYRSGSGVYNICVPAAEEDDNRRWTDSLGIQ